MKFSIPRKYFIFLHIFESSVWIVTFMRKSRNLAFDLHFQIINWFLLDSNIDFKWF